MSSSSRCVILLSGKRKSGKDFVAERLLAALEGEADGAAVVVRLSGPLKKCYAERRGLDYEELMSSGGYKEEHRRDMIAWSERIRSGWIFPGDTLAHRCSRVLENSAGV